MYFFPTLAHHADNDSGARHPPEVATSPVFSSFENVSHIGRSQRKAHSYLTSAFLRDTDEFPLTLQSKSQSQAGAEISPSQSCGTASLRNPPKESRSMLPPITPPLSAASFQSKKSTSANGEVDEMLSPVESDAGALDFEKYLVRRIEDEKRVRYRRAQTISSMTAAISA